MADLCWLPSQRNSVAASRTSLRGWRPLSFFPSFWSVTFRIAGKTSCSISCWSWEHIAIFPAEFGSRMTRLSASTLPLLGSPTGQPRTCNRLTFTQPVGQFVLLLLSPRKNHPSGQDLLRSSFIVNHGIRGVARPLSLPAAIHTGAVCAQAFIGPFPAPTSLPKSTVMSLNVAVVLQVPLGRVRRRRLAVLELSLGRLPRAVDS